MNFDRIMYFICFFMAGWALADAAFLVSAALVVLGALFFTLAHRSPR